MGRKYKAGIYSFEKIFFNEIHSDYRVEFYKICADKNIGRLKIMLILNIFFQIGLNFIMRNITPDMCFYKIEQNREFYLFFSATYVLYNVISLLIIVKLEGLRKEIIYSSSLTLFAVLAIMIGFVFYEAFHSAFEIAYSGSVYRLIASVVIIVFVPLFDRRIKAGLLLYYFVALESAASYVLRDSLYFSNVRIFAIAIIILSFIIWSFAHSNYIKEFIVSQEMCEKIRKLENTINDLEYLSETDPLVQIANRRFIDSYLERVWNQARRDKTKVFFMMADIDRFKSYNDTYGHTQGDECLKIVAATMKKSLKRSTDIVGRFGGEEFAVILTSINDEGFEKVAEKIRKDVEALKIPNGGNIPYGYVTISVGASSMIPLGEETSEALVERADKALYDAKGSGRNKVCFYK